MIDYNVQYIKKVSIGAFFFNPHVYQIYWRSLEPFVRLKMSEPSISSTSSSLELLRPWEVSISQTHTHSTASQYKSLYYHCHYLFTVSVEEILLGSADQYRFLCGGSLPVPGQSDSENFTQTMDSVTIMGFTQEESTCKRGASQIDGEENINMISYNTYLTTEQK